MIEFIGEIPEAPETTNIIYSHPYRIPDYQLSDFEINFDDFPLDSDIEKKLKKKQEIEEKKMKIMELNMLKALEIENAKKYDDTIIQFEENFLNDSERKKEIKNLNKFIGNLENCIADLTRYFHNYHSEKQNALFDKLNELMYESDLKLFGENENTRSEIIYNELASLKSDQSKKSKDKNGK